ncbi:MAG: tRNA epoxyqueuosine(34) reductase QueG [Parvibaculaceae bacterium]|nr:tRNA epoxyqueuosine(34) reductase QueG [Parvibaculaceae bacterium]
MQTSTFKKRPPPPATPQDWKAGIILHAREAGFDAVRFTSASAAPDLSGPLGQWLEKGAHGSMAWMAETAARRAHPNALWPEARSIIVLGLNYGPGRNPLEALEHRDRGSISVYARNRDYHDIVKKKLRQIARWLAESSGEEVKIFVDTAPVMEKPLAAAGGLGWQGKHTNLVSREFGSWLLLGSIFTTMELPADEAEADHCGSCNACLAACPTNAFPAPYQLDARRCISYLTIEHKGHIPSEFRAPIGNRIYGCDDCLAACPWNKFAQMAHEAALHARPEFTGPALAGLAGLDDAGFRTLFSGSPIKRIGRDRFVRNVLIAIGNSALPALAAPALALTRDPSPLVRAMAVWAAGRLGQGNALAAMAPAALSGEEDEGVRAEWSAYCESV